MSDLTEIEVIDRLRTSLREAGDAAVGLSIHPRQGPNYRRLRDNLLMVEGSCRQLAVMRADSRWLDIGMVMASAQQRSRRWLAGGRDPVTRVRFHTAMATRHPLFDRLAQNLAFMLASCDTLLNAATGIIGKPILPVTPAYHRPTGAPVRVLMPGETRTPAGIILKGSVH